MSDCRDDWNAAFIKISGFGAGIATHNQTADLQKCENGNQYYYNIGGVNEYGWEHYYWDNESYAMDYYYQYLDLTIGDDATWELL